MKTLILLSSLPESWSATITTVINYASNSKFNLDNIHDLILINTEVDQCLEEDHKKMFGMISLVGIVRKRITLQINAVLK